MNSCASLESSPASACAAPSATPGRSTAAPRAALADYAAERPDVDVCRLNFISLVCRSRMRSSALGRFVLFAVRPTLWRWRPPRAVQPVHQQLTQRIQGRIWHRLQETPQASAHTRQQEPHPLPGLPWFYWTPSSLAWFAVPRAAAPSDNSPVGHATPQGGAAGAPRNWGHRPRQIWPNLTLEGDTMELPPLPNHRNCAWRLIEICE